MMKATWTKPQAVVENFMANEYVAACGDSGVVYKFNCNAPAGTVYYYNNKTVGDGTIDGVYTGTGSATRAGGYHPCSKKHEADSTADFCDGFVDRNSNGKCDSGEEAIIWLEYARNWFTGQLEVDNWHATAELDMSKWETAKS